jgi:hypothetical protein
MKYICLGNIEPGKLPEMTEEQQQAMLDECFEYDDHLRANGYLAAALQTKRRCVGQEQLKRQDKPSKREEHR